MRSAKALPVLGLVWFALWLAAPAPPCSGAPLPPGAARSAAIARKLAAVAGAGGAGQGASPAAGPAAPTFQVTGSFGDLAVVSPTNLLTAAELAKLDAGFEDGVVRGLAVGPAGTLFIAGNDGTDSFLGQVDFATGAERTIGKIPRFVVNDIAFDGAGNLYGLTDNRTGNSPHSLLLISTSTAAVAVVKTLDAHGGASDVAQDGAIAFNPGDGSLYYADLDASGRTFVDRLAAGSFLQTPVLTTSLPQFPPTAMAFSQGKLWLFAFVDVFSAGAANIAAGLTFEGNPAFPTPDTISAFFVDGAVPNSSSCVPSPTAACLHNRFKVEITYDATPNNGSGPASVVLESAASVKFTFFDPTNIEMIVKVLDACGFNGSWWVLAGGLTDVGVAIKVTDTASGVVRNFGKAKGSLFTTLAATSAAAGFPCP